MNTDAEKIKTIARALRVLNALDERTRQGQMDPQAVALLKESEATVTACSGRLVLAAFRAWRDGNASAFDPTGGYQRPVDQRDTSASTMRERRGERVGGLRT